MSLPRPLRPLVFHPILRRYVWGGRRLSTLGKRLGPEADYAESWEICDRGDDQSVVADGPCAGTTLGELVCSRGPELLGRHHPQSRFPLLIKFLDTQQPLSVQVHPNDEQAARRNPPDLGKTEAWVVLDAQPGSFLLAGLKRGFDRASFALELHRGTAELCLERIEPRPGDSFFAPAGMVHALGPGLLVAEIQQSSDVTYRLWDWNRVDAMGQPRTLHIEQGLAAMDDRLPHCTAVVPQSTGNAECERLIACDKFVIDRWKLTRPHATTGDERCHVFMVLEGSVRFVADGHSQVLRRGGTALIPACVSACDWIPEEPAALLDVYMP